MFDRFVTFKKIVPWDVSFQLQDVYRSAPGSDENEEGAVLTEWPASEDFWAAGCICDGWYYCWYKILLDGKNF